MRSDIRSVEGRRFISGPLAVTDIHNAGSIIGVVFQQVLEFGNSGSATLRNEVIADSSGGLGWDKSIRMAKWTGTYAFDPDGKHVKCTLSVADGSKGIVVYADLIAPDMLLAEVYEDGRNYGRGQVFTER